MRKAGIVIAIITATGLLLGGCAESDAAKEAEELQAVEQIEGVETVEPEQAEYKMPLGEILDETVTETDHGVVYVVKAKIESSITNKSTIDKNYINAYSLIKEGGADQYDELQYWAVADMRDGSEGKAISFTVDKQTMDAVKSGKILENQLGDYVTDLWILPSLKS